MGKKITEWKKQAADKLGSTTATTDDDETKFEPDEEGVGNGEDEGDDGDDDDTTSPQVKSATTATAIGKKATTPAEGVASITLVKNGVGTFKVAEINLFRPDGALLKPTDAKLTATRPDIKNTNYQDGDESTYSDFVSTTAGVNNWAFTLATPTPLGKVQIIGTNLTGVVVKIHGANEANVIPDTTIDPTHQREITIPLTLSPLCTMVAVINAKKAIYNAGTKLDPELDVVLESLGAEVNFGQSLDSVNEPCLTFENKNIILGIAKVLRILSDKDYNNIKIKVKTKKIGNTKLKKTLEFTKTTGEIMANRTVIPPAAALAKTKTANIEALAQEALASAIAEKHQDVAKSLTKAIKKSKTPISPYAKLYAHTRLARQFKYNAAPPAT